MAWSNETNKALRQWLAPETAHTNHPNDEARFYYFIVCVWADEQGLWDEALAREYMKQVAVELHPEWFAPDTNDEDHMANKIIDDRLQKGTLILDFLSFAKKNSLMKRVM